jgi:replicative DNA helicase
MQTSASKQDIADLAPQNLPSERIVLGAAIEDATLLSEAINAGLKANDFFLSDHRRIFGAMLELREKNAPIDYVTVAEQIGNSQADFVLLASLIEGVVIEREHVLYHVGIVRKKSRLRKLQKVGNWLFESANENSADPDALAQMVLAKLNAGGRV